MAAAALLGALIACAGDAPSSRIAVIPHATPRHATLLNSIAHAPLPAGGQIEPEQWAKLTAALASAFASEEPARLREHPPCGESNGVTNLAVTANTDGSATFHWRYRNLGDYNQDSTISLLDLASLAPYSGTARVDEPAEEPLDGDLNSEINLQDVTPLAQHWAATVTGYVLAAAAAPDAPSAAWETIALIPFTSSAKPADRGWRSFTFQCDCPIDGRYYRVSPYYQDETQHGPCSPPVQFEAAAANLPQNLLATQGTRPGAIELAWDAVPQAQSYEVHRATSPAGSFRAIASEVSGALYTDLNVTQGLHYWYLVRARMPAGLTEFSEAAEGWPLSAPAAPQGVQATFGVYPDRIMLAWQPSPQADEYRIYRRLAATGSYMVIGSTVSAKFNDLLATPGVHYCYTVVARNGAGASAPSIEVNGMRSSGEAPKVLRVLPFEGTTGQYLEPAAYLSGGYPESYTWTFGGGAQPDITDNPSPYIKLGAPGYYLSTVEVQNQGGSDKYFFVLDVREADRAPVIEDVYPYCAAKESVATFSATTSGGLPTSWSWNFGGGAQPDITTAASPTVTLGGEGSYHAAVTVANPEGEDVFFFTLEVGPDPQAPAAPAGLLASDGEASDRIKLSWKPSAGALGYKLYRDGAASHFTTVSGTTTYADTGVADYLLHSYTVRAFNNAGLGQASEPEQGYYGLPAPSAVRATDGMLPGRVVVSWDSVPGAEYYYVYRWDRMHLLGAVTAAGPLQLADISPPAGVTMYLVYAASPAGESQLYSSDTGFPGTE